PDPLPLRVPPEPRPRDPGRGERATARTTEPPVPRRVATLEAVGPGVRLPGRRPAVGVRARPAGDDRRRMDRRRDRAGRARVPGWLVRTAHGDDGAGGAPLRRSRAVLARRGRNARWHDLPRDRGDDPA